MNSSALTYLANIVTYLIGVHRQLDCVLKGQKTIMAKLEEVLEGFRLVKAGLAEMPQTLAKIATGVEGVAKDVQALKDKVGQGDPGITAQDADGFVADLTDIQKALASVQGGLVSAADALTALDESTPDTSTPDTSTPTT